MFNERTKNKTLFFEDYYDTSIDEFDTTEEVDQFIESKTGKKLKVVRIKTNIL
jgi:hypothetical protein